MLSAASSSSSSNPGRKAQASSSGAKKGESSAAQAASKPGASSSEPAMKRSNSLPGRLPSHPLKPAEVQTVREPTTRPGPDTRSPEAFNFQADAGEMVGGARLKRTFMDWAMKDGRARKALFAKIESSPDHMQLIKSVHPKFEKYGKAQKLKAYKDLILSHPELRAELAKNRNELHAVPNYPTSSRNMEPFEQSFLTKAMRLIKEDVEKKPFHIHGELGVVGNRILQTTGPRYNPEGSVQLPVGKGDKYMLHSHPPFAEPFTSSASEADHKEAVLSYLFFNNKANEYVTNGKDVMHIHPASMELVKLIPLPRAEKFPEAFRIPDPQQPPRPFSNHEAPAAFKKDWQPPAGWKPPEDYPRD